jgi:hypothetical protein
MAQAGIVLHYMYTDIATMSQQTNISHNNKCSMFLHEIYTAKTKITISKQKKHFCVP